MNVQGVIFLVDLADSNDNARMYQARMHLHRLLNEMELRCAFFAIVLNVREGISEKKKHSEDEIHFKLGLHEVESSSAWRIRKFSIDISEKKKHSEDEIHFKL